MDERYPSAEEFLRRLRAVYCRHRGMSYEVYDALVAGERITFAELMELVDVLFCEFQNVGLYEFLFSECAAADRGVRERIKEIDGALYRIGQMSGVSESARERYAGTVRELQEERGRLSRR